MNVDFAFVCDYAEAGNKLHAMGIGFDTIYAQQVPATHPHFHLVVQLRTSVAEAGEKDVHVRLIDADGADVMPPVAARMPVPPPPSGSTESVTRMALAFNNVRFSKYGAYSLHLVLQGHEIVRVPLRVAQAPARS